MKHLGAMLRDGAWALPPHQALCEHPAFPLVTPCGGLLASPSALHCSSQGLSSLVSFVVDVAA